MSGLNRAVLAEKAATVRRHLARVAERLPPEVDGLRPATDASDAVILHLWQATQIVIDLAVAACVRLDLGYPAGYADAFRVLEKNGVIVSKLADPLVRAAGFRNVVAHAYDTLDMARIHRAAREGPADLLAFLGALETRLPHE